MTYEDLIDMLAADYSEISADKIAVDIVKRKEEIKSDKAEEIAEARADLVDAFDFYMEAITGEPIPDRDKKFLEDQFEKMEQELEKYEDIFAGIGNSGKKKPNPSDKAIDEFIKSFASNL